MNKIVKIVSMFMILYLCSLFNQLNEISGEILNNVNNNTDTNNTIASGTNYTKIVLGYLEGNKCAINAQCYNQIYDLICDKPFCVFSLKQTPFILALPF